MLPSYVYNIIEFIYILLLKAIFLTFSLYVIWCPFSSHVWLHMHLVGPSLATLVLVECHMLPIDWIGRVESRVSNCWDLEWEESLRLVVHLVVKLLEWGNISCVFITVQEIIITQEFSIESTYNHDFILRHLAHSCSLSLTDSCFKIWHANFLPVGIKASCCKSESLNCCWVLLAWVLDTSEDVDPSVVEVGGRVVVTSFIHLVEFHPVISLSIIQFDSVSSLVNFLSGSWNNDISIHNCAAWVTMSWVLHLLFLSELQVISGWVELFGELSALIHGVWKGLVVTSSKHIASWIFGTNLNHLEVVWKVSSVFYESVLDCIGNNIIDGDGLWIFLEHVYLIWELTLSIILTLAYLRWCKFGCHGHSSVYFSLFHL